MVLALFGKSRMQAGFVFSVLRFRVLRFIGFGVLGFRV